MGFDPVSYLMGKQAGGGGGGGVTVEPLSVSENGTYTAPTGKAYSPVTVDVFQLQTYCLSLGGAFAVSEANPPSVPRRISIVAPNCSNISQLLQQASTSAAQSLGVTDVSLALSHPCNAGAFLRRNFSVETVEFPNGLTIKSDILYFINGAQALRSIQGDITIQAGITSNTNTAFNCATLEAISFSKNTLYFPSVVFTSPVLTDASLVSIANGLDGTVSGATLTHHATAKARCQTLMGTVTDGVFTADAGGTVTLANFITQTKGWTLA